MGAQGGTGRPNTALATRPARARVPCAHNGPAQPAPLPKPQLTRPAGGVWGHGADRIRASRRQTRGTCLAPCTCGDRTLSTRSIM